AFFPLLVVCCIIDMVLHACNAPFRLLPSPLDLRLLDSEVLQVLGALLLVFTLALFVLALIAFGRSWRVGIDAECAGQLARGGIFAASRNPIFLALDLYFLGTFLINGTLGFLLFAVAMALAV